MKAIWKGAVLAESDDTIVVEGNHYFPPDSINQEYFRGSDKHTTCHWKGEACYYDIVVEGEVNKDAVWYLSFSDRCCQTYHRVCYLLERGEGTR